MKLAMILLLLVQTFGSPAEVGHEWDLLRAFPKSMQSQLQRHSKEFNLTRSARIQAELYREDLVWLSRGWDSYQLDVMVFVSLSLAKLRAADEIRTIESKSMSPEELVKLTRIQKFERDAEEFLEKLKPKVEEVKPERLKVYP